MRLRVGDRVEVYGTVVRTNKDRVWIRWDDDGLEHRDYLWRAVGQYIHPCEGSGGSAASPGMDNGPEEG